MTSTLAAEARWQEIATAPDERIDLAEAALVVASREYPDLDISRYRARIDEMGKAGKLGGGDHERSVMAGDWKQRLAMDQLRRERA